MTRSLIRSLIISSLALSLNACSLFSGDDSAEEATTEEGAVVEGEEATASEDGDFADMGEEGTDAAATPAEGATEGATTESADAGTGEPASDDDLFGDIAEEGTAAAESTPTEGAQEESLFPESPLGSDATAGTVEENATESTTTAETDSSTFAEPYDASQFESAATSSSSSGSGSGGSARAVIPVKKIEDAPVNRGGALLNRVYIVREGEGLSAISKKILGSERVSDLKKWNTYFAGGRSPKVGDKIYYPSPTNPTDTQMLTYYEEAGIPAQTYVAQEGDNIRSVAKNLLGHERSWMEVFATNPAVDSKGSLDAGTSLRYWTPGTAPTVTAPTQDLATNTEMPPPAPTDMGGDDLAPPPAPTDTGLADAGEDFPPPPPAPGTEDGMALGDLPPPPPPPPADDFAPPPPPPPPVANAAESTDDTDAMGETDESATLMMFAGLGLIALFIVLLLVRNKRRRSAIDLGQTQV